MDCHRCVNIRYDGCRYGRCSHPGHKDVVLEIKKGARPYNKQICPDFEVRKRCSNCKYWARGKYFADGRTPAKKGRCSLDICNTGIPCRIWKLQTSRR